jgi:2'-5' RNA ligase
MSESAPQLTLPSEHRDFPEWHRGREWYAVWAVDLDQPAWRQRCAAIQAAMADYFLPGYVRQPHITVALAGFPTDVARLPDDYPDSLQQAQIAALQAGHGGPFALEIGGADSFTSAAYLKVHDPAGHLTRLRQLLGGAGFDATPYVPHLTLGLYRAAFPLDAVLARLRAVCGEERVTVQVAGIRLLRYRAGVIGGELAQLAVVRLA